MQTDTNSNTAPLSLGKPKVLYIAGWGRSGSTILGSILGQIETFSLVGEIRHIWDRGVQANSLCSCGVPFLKCPFWKEVLVKAFGGVERVEPEKLASFLKEGLRTKHFLLPPPFPRASERVSHMSEYTQALGKLYRAVQNVTGSEFLVDTSKVPAYGYVLDHVEDIELYVLHLVRDPRATAYSWSSRRKRQPESGGKSTPMLAHSELYSSMVWNEWNLIIEGIWRRHPERYMLLRYEDFVKKPRKVVQDILGFLGRENLRTPFLGEREVSLGASHIFSGNPNRFDKGSVTIKADDEWKTKVSGAQHAMITSLTSPGLLRYGYPLVKSGPTKTV